MMYKLLFCQGVIDVGLSRLSGELGELSHRRRRDDSSQSRHHKHCPRYYYYCCYWYYNYYGTRRLHETKSSLTWLTYVFIASMLLYGGHAVLLALCEVDRHAGCRFLAVFDYRTYSLPDCVARRCAFTSVTSCCNFTAVLWRPLASAGWPTPYRRWSAHRRTYIVSAVRSTHPPFSVFMRSAVTTPDSSSSRYLFVIKIAHTASICNGELSKRCSHSSRHWKTFQDKTSRVFWSRYQKITAWKLGYSFIHLLLRQWQHT